MTKRKITAPDVTSLEQRIDAALRAFIADVPRMGWWALFAVLGLVGVWYIAPDMAKVTLYKLSLLPAAAYVLYRIDRATGEKVRPHELLLQAEQIISEIEAWSASKKASAEYHAKLTQAQALQAWAQHRYLRRALLIGAGLIAVALGS